MKNPKEIQDLIKARTAERDSVISTHNAMWEKEGKALQALQEQHKTKLEKMQQDGAQNQLKVTFLDGQIAELQKLLPKPKAAKKKK